MTTNGRWLAFRHAGGSRTPRVRGSIRLSVLVAAAALALAGCLEPAPNRPLPPTGGVTAHWENGGGFPDPFVMQIGDTYHAWATNYTSWPFHNINYSTSSGGIGDWSYPVDAMPELPDWAEPGQTWAPTVIRLGPDDFLLYFSARSYDHDVHCIGVAHAAEPSGPFVDATGSPLVCHGEAGGAIDPDVHRALDGHLYLYWKAEGWPVGDLGRLWGQRLTADGLGVVGTRVRLLSPALGWEGFVLENPAMTWRGGRYWLFYSANDWWTSRYATGVARCDGPLGPCHRLYSTPLIDTSYNMAGPGGLSVVSGAPNLLAFHAWSPPNGPEPERQLFFVNWSVRNDRVYIP